MVYISEIPLLTQKGRGGKGGDPHGYGWCDFTPSMYGGGHLQHIHALCARRDWEMPPIQSKWEEGGGGGGEPPHPHPRHMSGCNVRRGHEVVASPLQS
jgi:hypothetical protein